MITDIFRLDDNVPRIYVNESRDFQMLCRLFTYALNSPKYEAETLHYLNSGMLTNDRLLTNLCEKTGFMDGTSIKGEYLRFITENFGRLVRDKGAKTGICNAVYLYLLMYNISTACYVQIDRKTYTIHIGIKSAVKDIQVLYTILKYIVPTGWLLDIFFYQEMQIWQAFSYKDTLVNMVRKASATNALYIIRTDLKSDGMETIGEIGETIKSEHATSFDGPPADPGQTDNSVGFGRPSKNLGTKTDPKGKSVKVRGKSHITEYTGSLAINSMSTMALESFLMNGGDLTEYGTELWDASSEGSASGWFRFGDNKYHRDSETGRRPRDEEE